MLLEDNNGLVLDQVKEPALSRPLLPFLRTEPNPETLEPVEDPSSLDIQQVIQIARAAHITDERDGRPLWENIQKWVKTPPRAVVCDAIDDEPYVSSQINPLLNLPQEAVGGLELLARALGVSERYIAVYKNMYDLNTKIPAVLENVPVRKLGGKYPMERRSDRRFSKDHLLVGSCALIHLYRAVTQGKVQTTAMVTVAGDCVGNPVNLEVSLGMPLMEVLERCGLIQEPTHIVEGGAMQGLCVIDPEHTVIKADTRAVLAFRDDKRERRYNCIGCGRCVEVCPAGLNPAYLMRAIESHRPARALRLGLEQCIGCSSCSYICPARLELSFSITQAKSRLKKGASDSHEA